jgi:DNA-binding transcriptional ArsR family regulator
MVEAPEDISEVAVLFRGLADPTRLLIVRHLARGEHRVVDLMAHLGLAQSTVSGHLACLRDCGLVSSRAQGRASLYSLTRPELIDLLHTAEAFLDASGSAFCPAYTSPGPATTQRQEQRPAGLEISRAPGAGTT